jgi:hypothetical protein
MGIGHPPRNKKARRGNNGLVSLRHPYDDFFDALSPLLEEAATAKDDPPRRGLPSVRSLSKENARLRALAVGLSNLLGDLPARQWQDAARCSRNKS